MCKYMCSDSANSIAADAVDVTMFFFQIVS